MLKEYAAAAEGILATETESGQAAKWRKLSEDGSKSIASLVRDCTDKVDDVQGNEELQRTQQLRYDDLLYYFQYMHSRVYRKYSKSESKATAQ